MSQKLLDVIHLKEKVWQRFFSLYNIILFCHPRGARKCQHSGYFLVSIENSYTLFSTLCIHTITSFPFVVHESLWLLWHNFLRYIMDLHSWAEIQSTNKVHIYIPTETDVVLHMCRVMKTIIGNWHIVVDVVNCAVCCKIYVNGTNSHDDFCAKLTLYIE